MAYKISKSNENDLRRAINKFNSKIKRGVIFYMEYYALFIYNISRR